MSTRKQTYANTGLATISVANPNLDGTGATVTVITGGHTGTEINTITIKALDKTSEGMVRLFIDNGLTTSLIKEINIPEMKPTDVQKSFEITIYEQMTLNNGYKLLASTQNSDTFNVIANGDDWEQCSCEDSGCLPSVQQFSNTGIVNISEENGNLDGTGAMGVVLTAPSSSSMNGGTFLLRVNVKAIESTRQGMVRLFIGDSTKKYLATEIKIPATTVTDIEPAYRTECYMNFYLKPNLSLYASTQYANGFNIMVEGVDMLNCACIK